MERYVKLFGTILDSSVWQLPAPTKLVWITILAASDRFGEVHASIPGLAKRAGVTIPECQEALSAFLAPDPFSRSKDFEGRRIEEIDGGWRLLNHEKYRMKASGDDIRAKTAARVRRYRERKALHSVTGNACNPIQTQMQTQRREREYSPSENSGSPSAPALEVRSGQVSFAENEIEKPPRPKKPGEPKRRPRADDENVIRATEAWNAMASESGSRLPIITAADLAATSWASVGKILGSLKAHPDLDEWRRTGKMFRAGYEGYKTDLSLALACRGDWLIGALSKGATWTPAATLEKTRGGKAVELVTLGDEKERSGMKALLNMVKK